MRCFILLKISRDEIMDRLCITCEDLKNYIIPVSVLRELSDRFNKVHWDYISYYQPVDIDFIEDFVNKLNWKYLLRRHKDFSDDFLIKHKKYIKQKEFDSLFSKRQFSEGILSGLKIRKNNALWVKISRTQKLSRDFIMKNISYLSLEALISNINIDSSLKEELKMINKITK